MHAQLELRSSCCEDDERGQWCNVFGLYTGIEIIQLLQCV